MRKMSFRPYSCIIMLVISILLLLMTLFSAEAETRSGTYGSNITWTLDDNGVLTLTGNGLMRPYSEQNIPWNEYREEIQSVIIGDGITSIGMHSFRECYNLISVTIPDSVTRIGTCAFGYCQQLKYVTLPDSLKTISAEAFENTGLISIIIPGTVSFIGSSCFLNCFDLTTAILPVGITEIRSNTFCSCQSLKNIVLPQSISIIGDQAFSDCCGIQNIIIPVNVTSIGDFAFSGTSIQTISLHDTVEKLGEWAFNNGQTDIYYDNTEAYRNTHLNMGQDAFSMNAVWHFSGDSDISASGSCGLNATWQLDNNGILSINGSGAMYDYTSSDPAPWHSSRLSIKGITLSDDITEIGDYSFQNMNGLSQLILPSKLERIGSYAFDSCRNLGAIVFPDTVTVIGKFAFHACENLTFPNFPPNLTVISTWSFRGCMSLHEIVIPDYVHTIESYAFGWCRGAHSVIIPASVKKIDESAFVHCDSFQQVIYKQTEEYMKENLKIVPQGNEFLLDQEWSFHPSYEDCTNIFTLPASTQVIGDDVFSSSKAQVIIIPEGCQSVSEKAFFNCSNLLYVVNLAAGLDLTVPSGVTVIDETAQ